MSTPASLGYRMPAEWHPHSGTLLSWPQNSNTWPGERLERVEKVYLEIINVLHRYETVHLIVNSEALLDRVKGLFEAIGIGKEGIVFHRIPGNDVWARDFGPILVRREGEVTGSGEFAVTDWDFNAWGGKYPPFDSDDAVPRYLAEYFGLQRFSPGIVLEGGSIETNGEGVMLVTESVLLNPNRNPHLGREDIEQYLKDYLGQTHIIWLGEGLEGDDTDGHIDDLSRFLNPTTIMTMITEDSDDVNYHVLQENLRRLELARDTSGNPFTIIPVPMPLTRIEGTTVDGSEYVPASYANFYIANGLVLVPMYDERYDQRVLDLIRPYFPDRKVVGVDCRDLVWGQGSIHCITQQLYGI